MNNDFDLITRKLKGDKDAIIIPIADLHCGAREFRENDWADFCDYVKNNENVFITLGGDLCNNATRTSVSNVYDEVLRPREQKKLVAEYLKPIKDRILCAVSGNHERRSSKDVDDDMMYDILCKLDIEEVYRENIAFLKICQGNAHKSGKDNPTYVLAVTHGAGGGALTGGVVNRNERFAYVLDGVDCLVVGHSHKPFVTQPAKIKVNRINECISVEPFKVVSSTAWLDYGGYPVQKMLMPSSFAPQTIRLCHNKKEIVVSM